VAWYEKLDVSRIGAEAGYRIFYYLYSKGLRARDLGISESTFYNRKPRLLRRGGVEKLINSLYIIVLGDEH
jgi:hypothetical protein